MNSQGGSNMFNFGNANKKTGPQKTRPKLVKLDITLEEVYSGTTKEVTVNRYRACTDC